MSEEIQALGEFDVSPTPRVLAMLGQIPLEQWRCLAELIDNAIDGFRSAKEKGEPIFNPEVCITIPTSALPDARITVRDNGPGMTPEMLEKAVKAGYTSNNPVDSLGLFGMGFNIATARLGIATTVWTTRKEDLAWHGLTIDFSELDAQGSYRTPHLTKPKISPEEHGTEVNISRLEPGQLDEVVRPKNVRRISDTLGHVYSTMLIPKGYPISFNLEINGKKVLSKTPCIWSEERTVIHKHGYIRAYQKININLGDRLFCQACWQWLPIGQEACSCGREGGVVSREKYIRGWLGVQKYLHKDDYGIDFIRNGRKIEFANKELFSWRNELEYPIDENRRERTDLGRLVGEIHIDHCRVPYNKVKFYRDDLWNEVVSAIRGEAPLRPVIAKQRGFALNNSPLAEIYKGFRRTSPHDPNKTGAWEGVLLMPEDEEERVQDMVNKLRKGDSKYEDDDEWLKIIRGADQRIWKSKKTGEDDHIDGFADDDDAESGANGEEDASNSADETLPEPDLVHRKPMHEISQEYRHDPSNMRWDVRAWETEVSDSELESGSPWILKASTSNEFTFLFNASHEVFCSATLTPLDALLAELAWRVKDYCRDASSDLPFGVILTQFRERYAKSTNLNAEQLSNAASSRIAEIAKNLPERLNVHEGRALFEEFPASEKKAILERMAARQVKNAQSEIDEGRFLEHAPRTSVLRFFSKHPELFFDDCYWDEVYSALDYGDQDTTDAAKFRLVDYYEGLLADAIWLAEQDVDSLARLSREKLLRASLSLSLLAPAIDIDADET